MLISVVFEGNSILIGSLYILFSVYTLLLYHHHLQVQGIDFNTTSVLSHCHIKGASWRKKIVERQHLDSLQTQAMLMFNRIFE